jgi:hypothetical protein
MLNYRFATVRMLITVTALGAGIFGCAEPGPAAGGNNAKKPMPVGCSYWTSQVDPEVKGPVGLFHPQAKDEQGTLEAITCLLALRGRTTQGTFSGVNSPYISQILPVASVEVDALYYITFLYHQRWDVADGIALADRRDPYKFNDKRVTRQAYKLYRVWFEEVKRIGLAEARLRKLDPLKGSTIRWYGADRWPDDGPGLPGFPWDPKPPR